MPAATQRLIYRITHITNVPWVLSHGVPCRSDPRQDPAFVSIGSPSLIAKRNRRVVPIPPGGTLADYVPFYFGTHSVMLFNIYTGRVEGVSTRQSDIVYVVSSIEKLREVRATFLFTDRHAYVEDARFLSNPADLKMLDWPLIEGRNFQRDPDDPSRLERRAAECLVHRCVPVDALLGFASFDEDGKGRVQAALASVESGLPVKVRTDWYF